jgi:hypothetical protein
LRALVHVVPRAGAGEELADHLREIVAELRARAADRGLAVNALYRLDQDAFGARTPFRAGLEIDGAEAAFEPGDWLDRIGDRLEDVAHPDLSSLLVGRDVVFVAPEPHAPVRYQYLMRRNAQYTRESYLAYYRKTHSRFGIATPGIRGYVQLHVDARETRKAAARAGIGGWGADSVSELHLASQEEFLSELQRSRFGREAREDEEIFVDRAQSLDLCSNVDWHRG